MSAHPEAPGPRPPDGERVTFRRSDFVALRSAARRDWGIPDELRTEALFQAAKILTTSPSERHKLAAMKFLAALDLAERRAARRDRPETGREGEAPRIRIPDADERPRPDDAG